MRSNILYIVVPCYNEEEVLLEAARQLRKKTEELIQKNKIHPASKICFINDGSQDLTWHIIETLHQENPIFSGINLSRNKGHQNALLAGLMTIRDFCDISVSMDADLQDDIHAMEEMIDRYLEGYDIVYGVRSSRKTDTFFKRFTAESFYRILKLMGVQIIFNHADYRLLSKRVLDALSQYDEVNLFLRGLIPQIGYPSTTVTYERKERFAGKSKYPLKNMLSFAFDGITSFSIKPIRFISHLGIIISVISLGFFLWSLFVRFFGTSVSGWTSTVASIWMVGGIEMLCLGVIGEYIGKIYNETKQRPRYFIMDFLDNNSQDNISDNPLETDNHLSNTHDSTAS